MITRDYLYSADAGTNAQALADWLTANAQEYFDECTAEDMTVSCRQGETILMQIILSATIITIKAADASGELVTLAGVTGSSVRRIYYAWKCNHGIMLGISEIPVIFITKDAADRVACAAWTNLTMPGSASTAVRLNVLSTAASTPINAGFIQPQISGKTVLAPILVTDNDGTVLPYMYYTPYSQYNDAGILTVDGTEYLYSGCIAICDGEAGASGSTDLSNYYTKGQTDAKIAEVQGNVEENAAKIGHRTEAIKVYVDAESGSDSNTGLTASTAFATLGKALEATAGYGSEYIQLAAGTYDVPNKLLSLYGRTIVISGGGQNSTTIRGCIALYGTILVIGNLTLDGTDADYADLSVSAPLRVLRASNVRAVSCAINSAATFCAGVSENSRASLQSCTFAGASTNYVYLTTFGEVKAYTCTNNTATSLICGGGCVATITKGTNMNWTAENYGIVYVDGVQRSPVDLSGMTSATEV